MIVCGTLTSSGEIVFSGTMRLSCELPVVCAMVAGDYLSNSAISRTSE